MTGVEHKPVTPELESELQSGLKSTQIVGLQLIFIIISASVVYFIDNPRSGISVIWGGFCALVNVCLLLWRMHTGRLDIDANRQLRLMYRSVLERFFVVIGLLAFGMLRLKLAPLAILLGFVVGQAVLILVPLVRALFMKPRA